MSHSYTVQTLGPWHITHSTVWCNHCRIDWPLNTFLSIKWSLFSAYFWFQTAVTNGSSEVLPAGVIYKVSPSLVLFLEDHRDSYWKGVVCTPSSRFMEEENSSTLVFFQYSANNGSWLLWSVYLKSGSNIAVCDVNNNKKFRSKPYMTMLPPMETSWRWKQEMLCWSWPGRILMSRSVASRILPPLRTITRFHKWLGYILW